MRRRYKIFNYAMPTTAGPTAVATGTSIKTMMQLKHASNFLVVAWGYSFDVVPTAKVTVELLTTGIVAATVTAYVAADLNKYDDPGNAATGLLIGSTTNSGYTSTGEGSITTTRTIDARMDLGQSYQSQDPLDREGGVVAGDVLRIRATTSVSLGMLCWVTIEE